MDVIVVRQADGTLGSTAWNVDVGRDASLSPASYDEGVVEIVIRNECVASMKIGKDGRCFFIDGDLPSIYPTPETLAGMGLILGVNEAVFEISGNQSLFEATASIFLWDCDDPVLHPCGFRMLLARAARNAPQRLAPPQRRPDFPTTDSIPLHRCARPSQIHPAPAAGGGVGRGRGPARAAGPPQPRRRGAHPGPAQRPLPRLGAARRQRDRAARGGGGVRVPRRGRLPAALPLRRPHHGGAGAAAPVGGGGAGRGGGGAGRGGRRRRCATAAARGAADDGGPRDAWCRHCPSPVVRVPLSESRCPSPVSDSGFRVLFS
jgi:hypothetical protein